MIRLRQRPYIFGLCFLAIVILLLLYSSVKKNSLSSKSNLILGQATGITVHQFDKKGNLHYIGTASRAVHYKSNNTTLADVRLKLFDLKGKNPPWHVYSDKAFVWGNSDHVNLKGHVVFVRKKSSRARAIKFQSSELNLYTQKHLAITDKKVIISEPETKNITRAVGMNANWEKEKAHLLTNVVSTYEPKPSH